MTSAAQDMDLIADLAYVKMYADTLRKAAAEGDFRPGVVGYSLRMAELAAKAGSRIQQIAAAKDRAAALSSSPSTESRVSMQCDINFGIAEIRQLIVKELASRLGVSVDAESLLPISEDGCFLAGFEFGGFRASVPLDQLYRKPADGTEAALKDI